MVPLKKHTTAKDISLNKRGLLKKQLLKESAAAADDSMMVLQEFETFEEDLPFNGPYNGRIIPPGGSTPGDWPASAP
jgi:hypothetical protein